MKWIDVKQDLPEENSKVLIWLENFIPEGYSVGFDWFDRATFVKKRFMMLNRAAHTRLDVTNVVTHWSYVEKPK